MITPKQVQLTLDTHLQPGSIIEVRGVHEINMKAQGRPCGSMHVYGVQQQGQELAIMQKIIESHGRPLFPQNSPDCGS